MFARAFLPSQGTILEVDTEPLPEAKPVRTLILKLISLQNYEK
jgi:hypothetical protein